MATGQFGKAQEEFTRLKEIGKASPMVYAILIDALGRKNKITEAELLFTEGLKANLDGGEDDLEPLYASMIEVYAKSRNVEKAESLFKILEANTTPNQLQYNTIITMISKNSRSPADLKKIESYMRRMTSKGIVPNTKTLTSMVDM